MKKRFQVKNFYATTLSDTLTLVPNVDGVIYAEEFPTIENGKEFCIILKPLDSTKRQVLRAYIDGASIKYYGRSVSTPATFVRGDDLQINDVAELFNIIYDSFDDFGEIVEKSGLDIMVRGGLVKYNNTQATPTDTNITLTDNILNYVVFDFTDGVIKKLTSLVGFVGIVLANITTLGGVVTTRSDKRELFLGQGIDENLFEFVGGKFTTKTGVLKNNFVDLEDVPSSYSGQAGKFPIVNEAEDGITFTNITSIYSYNYENGSASDTWNIPHNMGTKNLLVSAYDNSDNLLTITDIDFTDVNNVVLHFAVPVDGRATLISAGGTVGVADHAGSHIKGGIDEVEADKLDIDFVPANYTRDDSVSGDLTHLTSHLKGLDNKIPTILTDTTVGALIDGATETTTPADTDMFSIWENVSGLLNKLSRANIKTTLKAYFDPLYKQYDAIVAASGGDYTTVGAAITAGKRNIFVKNGTYTEDRWLYTSAAIKDLSVTGEGGVIVTFNNISGSSYISTRGKLTIKGITFNVYLNATCTQFITYYNTTSGFSGKVDSCTFNIYTESLTNPVLASYNRTSFNQCYFTLNNTNNAALDIGNSLLIGCKILGGYVKSTATVGGVYFSELDIDKLGSAFSNIVSSTVDVNILIDSTIIDRVSDSIIDFGSSVTGTITIDSAKGTTIQDGSATVTIILDGEISGCEIDIAGNITFSGLCNVVGNTLDAGAKYLFLSNLFQSSVIVGNSIKGGTEFIIINDNTNISSNKFYNIGFGVVVSSDSNIITSNIGIGTITDNGASNIIANNN